MGESISFSGSKSNSYQKDSSVHQSAPIQTSLRINAHSYSAQTDSANSNPLIPVDTPYYALNKPLATWDSLLFRDIPGVKDLDVIIKPVFFRTSSTQENSLHSTRYTSFSENTNQFKRPESYAATPWFLASVFMCLILFTWLQYFFQKHIIKMFVAIFSNTQSSRLFSDKNILLERVFTFLNIIYIFTAGLFVFQLLKHYDVQILQLNDLKLFILSTSFILALFITRFILNWLVGQLFNWKTEMKEYNYNVFLSYKVLGLILLPIVILMAYIPEIQKNILIYIAFILVGIFYIIRYIRGMYLLGKKGFLLFYMILYFCTIEILPLLLLYRWLFISM